MRAPIFVDDDGDLSAFDTAEDACRYLEPIDVEYGVYVAYDATGRPLELKVERSGRPVKRESVSLNELPPRPAQDVELRRLLTARLRSIGVDAAGLMLEQVVSLAHARFRTR